MVSSDTSFLICEVGLIKTVLQTHHCRHRMLQLKIHNVKVTHFYQKCSSSVFFFNLTFSEAGAVNPAPLGDAGQV